jgi:hypothetical protein
MPGHSIKITTDIKAFFREEFDFKMRLEDFDVRKKISKGAFGDGRSQLIIDFDLDYFEFTWQSTMESTLR